MKKVGDKELERKHGEGKEGVKVTEGQNGKLEMRVERRQ